MSLRNQPYFPLYVQDYLTDEKLNLCTLSTQGVYIKILCILHKSDEYGVILLKQKDKQNESNIKNFALKLSKLLPIDLNDIETAINELIDEGVLKIDDDKLFQKRMVKDNDISIKRSEAGKKGGDKNKFAQAKPQANPEYENENENENRFKESVFYFSEKYSDEMLNNFINYWLSPQSNGKTRYEKEKTFDIEKRLRTWYGKSKALNYSKFSDYERPLVEKWVKYLHENKKYLIQESVDELKTVIDKNGGVPGFRNLIERAIASGWKSLVIEKKPEFVPKY